MKKKISLKNSLSLQLVFLIYSISNIVAKLASARLSSPQSIFSAGFILLGITEVLILGIYALLWQQVIKQWELSIAYANKAMTLFWGLLWGGLLFHERITFGKILGILIVFIGIVILNGEKEA